MAGKTIAEHLNDPPNLGMVRYDAMCQAIAACHGVDEVKELRNKARAIEVYAKQAQNFDAERKAAEIRIRAERRTGELLIEMKDNGQRDAGGRGRIESRDTTQLKDFGISRNQSSKWQQLAAVPAEDFERAVTSGGPTPTTEGIINASILKNNPTPPIDVAALRFWSALCVFEREEFFERDPNELIAGMTISMREDCIRLAPLVIALIERINDGTNGPTA